MTVATSGAAKAVLTVALCPEPLFTAITGTAAVFVRLKFAGAATPLTLAVTV